MKTAMKKIISASRRTDIPAFYYDWLQTSLKKGQVELVNPRFKEKTYKVDLLPESVHSIVLWSKDFSNVLHEPGYLDNYKLFFQYTINHYPRMIEPFVPAFRDSIRTLEGLLRTYCPQQFTIRFDPIMLAASETSSLQQQELADSRMKAFENLCRALAALGMQQCKITTSFICEYAHIKQRLDQRGIRLIHLDEALQIQIAPRLADIADTYGMTLYSCATPVIEQISGIRQGACIDGALLERLFGGRVSKAKDTGQRLTCQCSKSSDIGRYDQACGFQCVYCYACKR